MVYGNQAAIGQFLTSLAEGFVQTRIEILLLFAFIVALLLVFSIHLTIQKRGADRQTKRRNRAMLEHLVGKRGLDASDIELLSVLAEKLDKGVPEYQLLAKRHVFDSCARKALDAGLATETQLTTLRLKAGFRLTGAEETPASSAELPEGASILVQWGPQKKYRAVIVAQGAGSMTVKLDGAASRPARGNRVMVAFKNAAGVFSYVTRVLESVGSTTALEHSSSIERFQRRKYYRRREQMAVFVTAAAPRGVADESVLLELGAGGASLQNPRGLMRVGDRLEVSFPPGVDNLTLPARVLRVSADRTIIHVQFESPSESQRSRIMGFLFQQRKAG